MHFVKAVHLKTRLPTVDREFFFDSKVSVLLVFCGFFGDFFVIPFIYFADVLHTAVNDFDGISFKDFIYSIRMRKACLLISRIFLHVGWNIGIEWSRGGSKAAATSKMKYVVIIVNGWKPLTIITKNSILDVAAALDPPLGRISFSRTVVAIVSLPWWYVC